MKDNNIIILCTIIIILFIIFILLYMFSKYKKIRRVLDFSLESRNGGTFLERLLFDFSDFLESLVIFNGIARTYDRFIYEDSTLRKGIDYVAIKLILGILFVLMYFVVSYFYITKIYITLFIASFVLGFIIVDFYCIYKYYSRNLIDKNQYMQMVIIMNNGFKACKSVDTVLDDCVKNLDRSLSKQMQYVLNDYRMGISLQQSFLRMYHRVGTREILFISDCLKLYDEGVDLNVIFPYIEKVLVDREKLKRKLQDVKDFNLLFSLFLVFLPIVFLAVVLFSKKSYIDGIISDYGFAILLIEMIMYLLYLLFVRLLLKGRYV